jgi:hypothetical protein
MIKGAASWTSDQSILSAWQEGVSQASKDDALKQELLQQEGELLPSFAHHYENLKALSRRMRRTLQRQWKRSLAGLALLLALGQAPALAVTINVGGACTLARAIVSANNDLSRFCTPGRGPDIIELSSSSTLTLTAVDNVIYGPTGLPVIGSVVTIVGNGSTITRAGSAPEFRIFAVAPSGNLTLRQVALSGGIAPKAGSEIANDGGGVLNAGGTLSIIGSTISGNTADRGGAVQSQSSAGRVKVVIANTTITNNRAVAGTERTSGWGGGVDVDANTDLNISNSTISNNTAETVGGAIYLLTGTNIIMTNSTLTDNSAVKRAGGIATGCATLDLDHNLISGNTAPVAAEISTSTPGCQVASLNFNIFGHSGLTNGQAFNNFTPGATDITATSDGNTPKALNAILNTTLANNGGFTQTHALVMGSPAVDVITDGTCPPPAFDERGVARKARGATSAPSNFHSPRAVWHLAI